MRHARQDGTPVQNGSGQYTAYRRRRQQRGIDRSGFNILATIRLMSRDETMLA